MESSEASQTRDLSVPLSEDIYLIMFEALFCKTTLARRTKSCMKTFRNSTLPDSSPLDGERRMRGERGAT